MLSPAALSERNASALALIARRMAVKKGVIENRARAARGRQPKPAPGVGAEEPFVHTLRSLDKATGKALGDEVRSWRHRDARAPATTQARAELRTADALRSLCKSVANT